jgi:hypothetical protein
MSDPFVIFWSVLVLGSIGWYGGLVFYVGIKAGWDIREMIKCLNAKSENGK